MIIWKWRQLNFEIQRENLELDIGMNWKRQSGWVAAKEIRW